MNNDFLNNNLDNYFELAKNDNSIISQSESRQLIENEDFAKLSKSSTKGKIKMGFIATTAAAAVFAGLFAINNTDFINKDNHSINESKVIASNNNTDKKVETDKLLPSNSKDVELRTAPIKKIETKVVFEKDTANIIKDENTNKDKKKDKNSFNIQSANVIVLNKAELEKLGVKLIDNSTIEFTALQDSKNPRKVTLTKNSSAIERSNGNVKSPEPKFVTDRNGNKILSLFTGKNRNALLANVTTKDGTLPIATISDNNPNVSVRTMSIDLSNKENDHLTSAAEMSIVEFRKSKTNEELDQKDTTCPQVSLTVNDSEVQQIIEMAQKDTSIKRIFSENYIKSGNKIHKTRENIKNTEIINDKPIDTNKQTAINYQAIAHNQNANKIVIRKNILHNPKEKFNMTLKPGQVLVADEAENSTQINIVTSNIEDNQNNQKDENSSIIEVDSNNTPNKSRKEMQLNAHFNSDELGLGMIMEVDSNMKMNMGYSFDKDKLNGVIDKYLSKLDLSKLAVLDSMRKMPSFNFDKNTIAKMINDSNIQSIYKNLYKDMSHDSNITNMSNNVKVKFDKDKIKIQKRIQLKQNDKKSEVIDESILDMPIKDLKVIEKNDYQNRLNEVLTSWKSDSSMHKMLQKLYKCKPSDDKKVEDIPKSAMKVSISDVIRIRHLDNENEFSNKLDSIKDGKYSFPFDTLNPNDNIGLNLSQLSKLNSELRKIKINIDKQTITNGDLSDNKNVVVVTKSEIKHSKQDSMQNDKEMKAIITNRTYKYDKQDTSGIAQFSGVKDMEWAAKDFDEMPAFGSAIFNKDKELKCLEEYQDINKLIPISIKFDNNNIDYILWYEPNEELINSLPTKYAKMLSIEYNASKSGETCGNTPNAAPLMDVWKACDGDVKNLGVAPNPAKEKVTISYDLLVAKNISISLNDLTGMHIADLKSNVYTEKGNHSDQINLPNNLASGMYYIVLKTDQGETAIQRTIVQ
ncbi:MAG: T9SS type A sorting domain-containing protein [Candidatus Kapabacteria bacterium]|nr:T9SS type A sorting domain-containing protein [Candidatus Kapabacteria bacterium]